MKVMKRNQKSKFVSERNMPRLNEAQGNKAALENWTMKYGEKFYRLKNVDKRTVQQTMDRSNSNTGNYLMMYRGIAVLLNHYMP